MVDSFEKNYRERKTRQGDRETAETRRRGDKGYGDIFTV
jgi:hypothetical protein